MVACTFSALNVNVRKPLGNGYNENPTTIGAKIRNRRLELQLFQRDVAVFCGVSEDTITYWENGRAEPQIHLYPKVIELLGYFPFDIDTTTIGGKIKFYRYVKGLNQEKFSKMLGVDESTIYHWENNTHAPLPHNMKVLQALFLQVE